MQLRAAAPARGGPGALRAEQGLRSRAHPGPAQWRAPQRGTRVEGPARLQCELASRNAAAPPAQRVQGIESALGAWQGQGRGRAGQSGLLAGAEKGDRTQRSRVHRAHLETPQLFQEEEGRGSTEGDRILSPWAYAEDLPTQADAVSKGVATVDAPATKVLPDIDYLQELLAIQQQGPRNIGFFGTRNMGYLHQQLIEILSYAMVITNNHIFTSGAAGTNAAVIRGALRAERPDLLTVILPQSLGKQPPESQELLLKVQNVIEMPHNDHLPLIEASRLCNMDILSHVQQVICFAFHDSRLLMETCQEAKNLRKIVTLFYLD